MKQLFAVLACLFFTVGGSFYYFTQAKQTALFNKHIIDSIHSPKINVFFEAADACKYAQDYARARIAFEALLPKTKKAEDSLYIFNQLIYCSLAMNEDSWATKDIQKLEHFFPDVEKRDPSVLGDYFYNKGVLSYRIFHPKEAAYFLQKSLLYLHQVYGNEHLKEAQCLATLGLLHYEYTDSPDSAFLYLPKAYTIFQKNKDLLSAWSAECLLGMSMISRSRRQYDEATGYCEQALTILKKQTFNNKILTAQCLVDKARAVNMRLLKATKAEDKQRIHQEVESYFRQAVAICPQNSVRLQECYHYWARQYARVDSVSDAHRVEHFWETLTELEQVIHRQGQQKLGFPNHLKGIFFEKQSKKDSAIWYQKQFLQLALIDTTISPLLFTNASNSLAQLYEKLFDALNEPRFLDSSLYYMRLNAIKYAGYDDLNMPWSALIRPQFYYRASLLFVGFSYDAQLFFKKYKRTGDVASLEWAMKIAKITDTLLFSKLTSQDDDAFDFFQGEAAEFLYSAAIQSAAAFAQKTSDKKYLDDVFRFGERVRSFLLYRDMDSRDSTTISPPRQSLKDSIRQTEAAINTLKWATEHGQTANVDLMQQQNLRERLHTQLKNDFPQYYKLKSEQPIPSIEKVQSDLKPNQWFIQYTFSDSILNILFISPKTVYLHQTMWDTKMDEKLTRFCHYLSEEGQQLSAQEYAQLGFELYQKLLPKLPTRYQTEFEACQELIISPDRALNLLPYETLVASDKAVNYAAMPYLLHRYPISYAPSWNIYSVNSQINLPQHPTLKAYTYIFDSKELPSAKVEMANLTRIFGKNAVLAIGRDCSKEAFERDTLTAYDILHLSLHAESDPLSKYNNKIYFAPKYQDKIYGFDLLKRRFVEKLVVLSACQSAYGVTKKGEGTYALSRIFLRMGVPHVVASLWSVTEAPTERITTAFYEHLILEHQSPTLALWHAKCAYLETADSFKAQPRFWAGLVCVD